MMNEFLLEIYSEEIPARMQLEAQQQAKDLFAKLISLQNLRDQTISSFITPQRLSICLHFAEPLYSEPETLTEERRGPRINSPEAALKGFAKTTGQMPDQWIERDGYWYALVSKEKNSIIQFFPQLVTEFLDQFAWPKSMRWYHPETKNFTRPWIRPIRSVLCLYNGQPLRFKILGLDIISDNQTYGHRFLAPQPIIVKNFIDYRDQLRKHFVILDHREKQRLISKGLEEKASELGLVIQENQKLLEEVAGLVDYPFVHIGKIDERFMTLPAEVLSTCMRVHQKYFSLLKGNKLAPYFGFVTNINPSNPEFMEKGFERVLRARLSDAAFFYESDTKQSLEALIPKLDKIVFSS